MFAHIWSFLFVVDITGGFDHVSYRPRDLKLKLRFFFNVFGTLKVVEFKKKKMIKVQHISRDVKNV